MHCKNDKDKTVVVFTEKKATDDRVHVVVPTGPECSLKELLQSAKLLKYDVRSFS